MKTVSYSKDAVRTLSRMPVDLGSPDPIQDHAVRKRSEDLANNVKALAGMKGYFRLRVGDWRVIFRNPATSLRSSG